MLPSNFAGIKQSKSRIMLLNPRGESVIQPRYLYLLVVASLALIYFGVSLCTAIPSSSSASTVITASVVDKLSLVVPGIISNWQINPDSDNEYQYSPNSNGVLQASTNHIGGCQVNAIDDGIDHSKGSECGFMQSGGNFLHNYLRLALWENAYSGMPTEKNMNSKTQVYLMGSGQTGTTIKYVSWRNLGSWSDIVAPDYTITIKFTISNNS